MPREIESRVDLVRALARAAEVEHAALCRYLFAAASLKKRPEEGACTWPQIESVRAWQSSLLLVARQEMEHLGLVCNLLSAVGCAPHFGRSGFPMGAVPGGPGTGVALERFSAGALERFVAFERSHEPASRAEGSVGALYRQILTGLEALDAAAFDLWVGPPRAQVSNETMDIPAGWYDIDVFPIRRLADARVAVHRILETGQEGEPEASGHAGRLGRVLSDLRRLQHEDSAFEPSRPVVTNPVTTSAGLEPAAGGALLTHPLTVRAARLFNGAYGLMLLMLLRFYTPNEETPEERDGLRRIAFFPLMTLVMRPLGEILTQMPASSDEETPTAGPTFEPGVPLVVQPYKRSAWLLYHECLQRLAVEGARLEEDVGRRDEGWARSIAPRVRFLRQNFEGMAVAFARYVDMDTVRSMVLMDKLLAGDGHER